MEISLTNVAVMAAIPLAFLVIIAVIFFFDDLIKVVSGKKKCKICGGVGWHKLSCPHNTDKQARIFMDIK
jgi:hypothetical protein